MVWPWSETGHCSCYLHLQLCHCNLGQWGGHMSPQLAHPIPFSSVFFLFLTLSSCILTFSSTPFSESSGKSSFLGNGVMLLRPFLLWPVTEGSHHLLISCGCVWLVFILQNCGSINGMLGLNNLVTVNDNII